MKHAITALIFVIGVGTGVEASEATKAIVGSYLQIHTALAADKTDGVKTAAQAIADQAKKMGPAGSAIEKTATAVAGAKNLKAARDAFGPLSDAVIAAASADGWKDLPDTKVGFCSMVNRSWIQTDEKIKNPYYGSSMQTCGQFQKR